MAQDLIPVSFDNWQFKDEDFDEEADGCRAIVFYNRGEVTCTINKLPLEPNNFIEYEVSPGEIDVTTYSCTFEGVGLRKVYFLKKRVAY